MLNDKYIKLIGYIPFGGLKPDSQFGEQCNSFSVFKSVHEVWKSVEFAQRQVFGFPNNQNQSLPVAQTCEQDVVYQKIAQQKNKDAVVGIFKRSGIMPSQLTEDDVLNNIDIYYDLNKYYFNQNLLNAQFALIFKLYHLRYLDNKFNRLYQEEMIEGVQNHLTDEEFKNKYGIPPWEFVNSILERLRLNYKVNDPMGTKRETTFKFKLIHKQSGIEIDTNNLSTGEKTLILLASTIYNSTGIGNKPEVLIFDEPDASLHPSMSKMMLEILQEEIVKKHRIPVIISTHSLTTIACAPPNSLYKISSSEKVPLKCDLQDSLKILAYGISNLNISIENRRQVFVEHNYDVVYLESLFNIVSRYVHLDIIPQFLPPHNLNGSNCSAVLEITRKLRDMGNSQIYGLIDWDCQNEPEDQIIILGLGKRYAIENYIFESHFLGIYLVRQGFLNPAEIGFKDCNSYLEVTQKISEDPASIQTIVNNIENIIFCDDNEKVLVKSILLNGESINVNEKLLTTKGHTLENLCRNAWPKLNSIKGNNDGDSALKKSIINTVINEFPDLLSQDILDTFKEFK